MDEQDGASQSFDEISRPESPEQEPEVDPWAAGVGMDAEDTLELLRDKLAQGMDILESLSATDRTVATVQAGLQTFSYDMHVKLGMEVMALRLQEANMRLNAEQFGEQLQRRAFVRDMLKRVAKEDNWVQYPASDLERISRALNRSASKIQAAESDLRAGGSTGKADSGAQSPPSYAKWLERRQRPSASHRTAFGTTIAKTSPRKKAAATAAAATAAAAAAGPEGGDAAAAAVADVDVGEAAEAEAAFHEQAEEATSAGAVGDDATSTHNTFGMAPRLMGPISAVSSRRTLGLNGAGAGGSGRRASDSSQLRSPSRAGGDTDAASIAGSVPPGGIESHHSVRFQAGDGFPEGADGRADLEDAAEILGLSGGGFSGRESRRGCRPHSRLARADGLAAVEAGERASSRGGDWRSLIRKKRGSGSATNSPISSSGGAAATADGSSADVAADTDEELKVAAVKNPLMALRLSVRKSLSYKVLSLTDTELDGTTEVTTTATAATTAATTTSTEDEVKPVTIPEVEAPLAALEDVVKAVESISDGQLQVYVRAMEASAAAAAATAAAAVAAVEDWAAGTAQRLSAAREMYSVAHTAKLESITCITDLQQQVHLLREWLAGREQKRLAAATASLEAQRERLSAVVNAAAAAAGGSSGVAAAVERLLTDCDAAADELDNMAAAVEEAAAEAEAQLEERERRRAALRLIEEECVKLAEEMAAQEETERLARIMKEEAEAERRMADAKDEAEARRHAMMAAMLMGQEEWVLEKEARLAALRAAERDQKRLGVLRSTEEEKARAAAAVGRPYDKTLLEELVQLEEAARGEARLRRQRLEEALAELKHFEEMLQRQHDGAAAAPPPPPPSTSPRTSVSVSSAPVQPPPALPPPQLPAGVSPEALVRYAVTAVRECADKAAAVAAAAGGGTGAAAAEGGLNESSAESDLDQASREAQARLSAARLGLEAVVAGAGESRRKVSWRATAVSPSHPRSRSLSPTSAAAAATVDPTAVSAAAAASGVPTQETAAAARAVAAAAAAAEEEDGEGAAAGAAPSPRMSRALTQLASLAPRDSAALRSAQQELQEEQARLAAIVADADGRLKGRSSLLLQDLVEECEGLAAAVATAAEVAAEAPGTSVAPSAAVSSTGEAEDVEAVTAAAAAAAAAETQRAVSASSLAVTETVGRSGGSGGASEGSPASPMVAAAAPALERGSTHSLPASPALLPQSQSTTAPQSSLLGLQLASSMPPSLSPRGSLGAPILRMRPSGSGQGGPGSMAAMGLSPRSDATGPEWPLRPDPLSSVSSYGSQPSGAGGGAVLLGGGGGLAPPPLPAVLPHARAGGAHSRAQQHGAGAISPYSRTLPPPQVILPVVGSMDMSGSTSRKSLLVQPRPGPGSGTSPTATPDFLPRISGASTASAGAGTALAAPPPTPRSITSDGTATGPSLGALSPSGALPTTERQASQQPPPPPQQHPMQPHQHHQQQQQLQGQHTLWAGAALESRASRSLPASPEPLSRAAPASSPAAAATHRGGGSGPVSRQQMPYSHHHQSAPLSAPSTQVAGAANGRGAGVAGSVSSSSSSPPRGGGGSGGGGSSGGSGSISQLALGLSGPPPHSMGLLTIGDTSYSQWVSSQNHVTPRALEAARQVDEVLARLPPELHSVILNAAELLTMEKGGYEPIPAVAAMMTASSSPPSGGDGAGAGAGGSGGGGGITFVPAYLQALPPVVSRYVTSQLQRIYHNANSGVGGSGSVGGTAAAGGKSSGAAAAQAGGASSTENVGLIGGQSLAALDLLSQLLPTIAQGVGEVRKGMSGWGGNASGASAAGGGGGSSAAAPAAGAPQTTSHDASRCPIGTGAMHGSPLRSSRKGRSILLDSVDGGSSSHSSASSSTSAAAATAAAAAAAAVSLTAMAAPPGSPTGARIRHQTLSLSTQPLHHHRRHNNNGLSRSADAGGGAAAASRRSFAPGATKAGKGGNGDPRNRSSAEMERWMIRGINMQTSPKGTPGTQYQQQQQQQRNGAAVLVGPPLHAPGANAAGGGAAAAAAAAAAVAAATAAAAAAAATAAGSSRGGGAVHQREAFLPPLGNKQTTVRH